MRRHPRKLPQHQDTRCISRMHGETKSPGSSYKSGDCRSSPHRAMLPPQCLLFRRSEPPAMPEPDVTTTAITAGIERAITRLLSSPDLLAAIRQGVRDGVWHLWARRQRSSRHTEPGWRRAPRRTCRLIGTGPLKVAKHSMPRGSAPGERRGGRQPGTPNKHPSEIKAIAAQRALPSSPS